MERGSNAIDLDLEHPSRSTYDLRTRKVIKQPKNKNQQEETSILVVKKNTKVLKSGNSTCGKFSKADGSTPLLPAEDLKMEDNSQESVSMLQDCYQENSKNDFPDLMESCTNTGLEVIDIYSDEELENPVETEPTWKSQGVMLESSTQTDFPAFRIETTEPREREMAKHAKFISSVVKLKAALSSKSKISDKKLWSLLQGEGFDDEGSPSCMEVDAVEQPLTVPKETIGYVLRASDVENVFRETVQAVLLHLEEVLESDMTKIAFCWKNSVYEAVVEILRQAADSEAGAWKMVASFLSKTVESIVKDEKSKNLTLESKTNFIISFCQSTHLTYNVINCTIQNLKKIKTIQRQGDSSLTKKLSTAYLTKNSYFLLRILESSLEFLKTKLDREKTEEVFIKKPDVKNYNVLEMWKKHWNRNEAFDEQRTGHEWQVTVSEWCKELDEILLHCLNHVPVLSMAVERCGETAKEILKKCHPGVMEGKSAAVAPN